MVAVAPACSLQNYKHSPSSPSIQQPSKADSQMTDFPSKPAGCWTSAGTQRAHTRARVCSRSAGLTSVTARHQENIGFKTVFLVFIYPPQISSWYLRLLSSKSSRCVQVTAASWPRPPSYLRSHFIMMLKANIWRRQKTPYQPAHTENSKTAMEDGDSIQLTTPTYNRSRPHKTDHFHIQLIMPTHS